MMEEEQKEKYANFLDKVSEILGLNRPVDILRLCAVTDEYFRPIEKRIAELEQKISVLLSCKNCPENKDGLICQKEYEGKCLAQKIQFIKELQQENAELKEKLGDVQMQKAGEKSNLVWKLKIANEQKAEQLTKAKEIISEYVRLANLEKEDTVAVWQLYHKAEQFLNSEVEK